MALRSGFCLVVLLSSLLLPAYDSAGYEAMSVSDGGTIKGRVVYTAAPPAPRKIVHRAPSERRARAPAALQSTMPTVLPFRNRCPQGQAH